MSLLNSSFVGKCKRLEAIDIGRIAKTINCGEDELRAFMEVESSGSGFDYLNRPKMLFEPHLFYRFLPIDKRQKAVSLGLAYQKWGERPYPKESYTILKMAMGIDEDIALKSCSWGLGQILGSNHGIVGYKTVQDMIVDFMDDEETHLEAVVMFLIHHGIDDDLMNHNWDVVARIYNGPSYKQNNYHIKLSRAYNKWRSIRDEVENPGPKFHRVLAKGSTGQPVKEVQEKLKILADGFFGQKTENSVKEFQKVNKLPRTGVVDIKTWNLLFKDFTTQ